MVFETPVEITYETIKSRAVKGVAFLTGRTFIVQIISQISILLLTIFLTPSQFGVFFLVSAVVNFFAYFSDIGLAAALIQKKESPKDLDLKTVFTVQQILVVMVILVIFILTPLFKGWYTLSMEGVYLIWALTFSLFLSSLKTIPSIILERQLSFNKLIFPQIIETLFFYLVAVYLAWNNFGITSFTIAVLVRGFMGLIVMYLIQPWKPGIACSKSSLKTLLKFGIPYQFNTMLAMVKDEGLIVVLGGILGTNGIGLLGWAQKWGTAPLRFFMDQIIKVTFPAFSRLQEDKQLLSKAVSKSILFVSLLVFPSVIGLILLAPILTVVIPRYEKWQPALFALSLIGFNSLWAAVTTPLTNALSAIGKIKVTFRLMIMWTVLTWMIIPLLSIKYGVTGTAAGFAIVGSSSIIAMFVAAKYIKINYLNSVVKPLICALIMGVTIYYAATILPQDLVSVFILIFVGIAVYSLLIFLLLGEEVTGGIKSVVLASKNSS